MAALATALAAALVMVLWSGSQALAGGPTSVLVVSPESKQSASLYFSDKEYGRLSSLLGEPGEGQEKVPPGLGVGAGRQLNMTWLLHDVQPWRVDRVYPDTPGSKEVWIHTSTDIPEKFSGYWHTAQKPDELRSLLHRLGVMGKRAPGGAPPVFPSSEISGTPAAAAPGAAATASATSAATARGSGIDWWWAVPCAGAGAAAALLLRPLVMRLPETLASSRRRRESGPRQELRDI
ncbi:hypothetical protein [Streptomyces sp. cg35]|uniref:hypothetical protein n=1 Tax=Streptomyces sp. cg35 TaxID=3421650 RepID=UPI003D16C219